MKLTSHKIDLIIEKFENALADNYKLFSLNADDTSAFGSDNSESLSQLLSKLVSYEGDYKIIITECNPVIFADQPEFENILSSNKIALINLPLQSGSSAIIKKMNRHYEPKEVIQTIKRIKKSNPKIKINTHIIVGFPGEKQEDFQMTHDMLKDFKFNRAKIFIFSERPNTQAEKMPDKIPEDIKQERHTVLKKLLLKQTRSSLSLSKYIVNFTRPT